jgi:hypothetical protein
MSDSKQEHYYIVEALRWGEREDHSYVLGLYSDLDRARAAAEEHTEHRGGKYQCLVHQCCMDEQVDSDWSASMVYQTRIAYEVDEEAQALRNLLHVASKNTKLKAQP